MSAFVGSCGITRILILLLSLAEISFIHCFQRFDPDGMRIVNISCNHTGMEVHITSRRVFKGIIYTQGNGFNPSCRYTPPEIGTKDVIYFIPLTDCGNLLREVDGYIHMSNTLIAQKHQVVETDSDIVQSLSCKVPISQSKDIQVFSHIRHPSRLQQNGLESWMDFYSGSGIIGVDLPNKLSVGDEFSIVVHLKDGGTYKDLEVEKCWAHDNETINTSNRVVEIFNHYACQYSDWIPGFTLSKGMENISDVMSFGLLKAFKFPDSNNLHITCSIQICDNFCIKYCEVPEPKDFNSYLTRMKRSDPDMNNTRDLKKRNELMRATIKALGAKLLDKKKGRLSDNDTRKKGGLPENDAHFYRRFDEEKQRKSGNTHEIFASQASTASDVQMIVDNTIVKNEEHEMLDDESNQVFDITANNAYSFNLTNNLVIFTDHEFNFRYEYRSAPRSTSDCIAKARFLMAVITLSFVTISLIIACICLVIQLRKQKKKAKKIAPDNYLLYSLY